MSIRVLLVDDQDMVRSGFRLLLAREEDIEVVGEAADGAAGVAAAARLRPDVVLMDVRMPRMDGLEATRRIVRAGGGARVVVLTTFDEDEYLFEALRAGVSGFLLKDAPADRLLDAVRVVANGEALLAPSVTRRVISEFARRDRDSSAARRISGLTEREQEVLRHMGRGLSNAEIADALVVTPATVKTHVARVLAKMGARDRLQAVVAAYESGFMDT